MAGRGSEFLIFKFNFLVIQFVISKLYLWLIILIFVFIKVHMHYYLSMVHWFVAVVSSEIKIVELYSSLFPLPPSLFSPDLANKACPSALYVCRHEAKPIRARQQGHALLSKEGEKNCLSSLIQAAKMRVWNITTPSKYINS